METVDSIKKKIAALYESDPHIHISICMTRPKLVVEAAPAVITAVYRNVFQVEECSDGMPKRHTLQYADVYIRQIRIAELALEEPVKKK